jgi:hypothetical protein
MLVDVLVGVCGIALLMALWLSVQAYIRERYQWSRDRDALEDMTHGCGNCDHSASCGSKEDVHECRH